MLNINKILKKYKTIGFNNRFLSNDISNGFSNDLINDKNLIKIYKNNIKSSVLKDDSDQLEIVEHLQELNKQLINYSPKRQTFFDKLLKRSANNENKVKGLYLYGSVGCGKTMLMDLFYDNCVVDTSAKRRVHFHSFMIDFHNRVHELKKQLSGQGFDPIERVAESICRESWLLCLDEFQVTDIGDAMILKLLFNQLFAKGIVMIATSNRAPDDLYKNGLQRSHFLPFIPLLKKYCKVLSLDSGIDYRQRSLPSKQQIYFLTEEESDKRLDRLFKILSSRETDIIRPKTVIIKERKVLFNKTCGRVVDCTFDELCDRPLGAIDYLTMAQLFHTIIIRNIPQMSLTNKPQTRRFITLIDTLYDNRVRVLFSAEAPPNQLFATHVVNDSSHIDDDNRKLMDDLGIKLGTEHSKASIFSGEEEVFAFERTISRITEMQTQEYWDSKEV